MGSTSSSLLNPLAYDNLNDFLTGVLEVIIIFALPIIVFLLIYAGFLYATARGNPEQIKRASLSLLYGVIGGVIILAAVAIAAIVISVVELF